MKASEKASYIARRGIAYYSGFGGLEIKGILYGIDDQVIFTVGAWTGAPEVHMSRIRYGRDGAPFFTYRRNHIPLCDCMRM